MYKILIKYSDKNNVWQFYGTTTTSTTASTSFKEFETDDVDVLRTEILRLDSIYGSSNIRVIEDVTLKYSVDVVLDTTDSVPEDTENNEEQNSGEQP